MGVEEDKEKKKNIVPISTLAGSGNRGRLCMRDGDDRAENTNETTLLY
jgi:hypothetical protein